MGWNTWCTDDLCGLVDRCSDALVSSIADAFVEQGLDKLGYSFVNMDDCWSAKTRDASGNLVANAARFPRGMSGLAKYVHSKGLKIGLYTCSGTLTCKNSLPGSAGHWIQDANTIANWKFDFVKMDYCHADKTIPPKVLYQNMSDALNATGREMVFSLCEWGEGNVSQWGYGLSQMYRIQMDHIPFFNFKGNAAGVGFGQGTWQIIEFVATLNPSTFVRRYGWMDPDFLETLFPTMSFVDSRTEFSFWSLWSAPLIISTDIRNLTQDMRSIIMNEDVIAIDQDGLCTAGERIIFNSTSGAQVWFKPLYNGDAAILLYNSRLKGNDVQVSVQWSDLPTSWPHIDPDQPPASLYPAGAAGSVRDLWGKKDLGLFNTSVSFQIAPRDVMMLRVSWVK
mmetsp:Transcript_30808/g.60115  ORF Transcript_30808/g.60115 Transcript_30808/m.60115 type:complete len:394 (-) Transcript_30808:320-1501(-)